jgi:hypothetical protein
MFNRSKADRINSSGTEFSFNYTKTQYSVKSTLTPYVYAMVELFIDLDYYVGAIHTKFIQ